MTSPASIRRPSLAIKLIEITESGVLPDPTVCSDQVADVVAATVDLYCRVGFVRPWIAYVAMQDDVPVGTCAFKSAPVNNRVEIAYWTFRSFSVEESERTWPENSSAWPGRRARTSSFSHRRCPKRTLLRKLGFALVGLVDHPEDGPVWEWEYHRP